MQAKKTTTGKSMERKTTPRVKKIAKAIPKKVRVKKERKTPARKPKSLKDLKLPEFHDIIENEFVSEEEKKRGQPEKYTKEKAEEFCLRIMMGESLRSICTDPKMWSAKSHFRYKMKYPEYNKMYENALQERPLWQHEVLLDMADGLTDETRDIQEKRLKLDTYKWSMARMNRSRFGDKQEINHSGEVTRIIRMPEKKDVGAPVEYGDE